jgi:polyribonucleotide nucleotidyltransferase
VTLGSKLDKQLLDSPNLSGYSDFMLHYNFPAFSTGEARPNRGPGRREIGHGNLASRGIKKMLPEDVGYTIRIVSDILESNGSSSMATVCASSLALMDAGIKLKSGLSGIAMGMIADEATGKYAILSDILGDEDHLGDMDFKVVGNATGIYACQMDMKVNGLSYEVLEEALAQSTQGRMHILGEMEKTMTAGREDLKEHTPRIVKFSIEKDKIGAVIGTGGKVIQELQAETNTTITIEEVDGKGVVEIMSANKSDLERAKAKIDGICEDAEVGKEYDGIVKGIMDFGAFVEFLPGKQGLLHISEISWKRLESMDGVMEEGEEVRVKLLEIDQRSGKFKLSRKVLLPKPEGYVEPAPRERRTDDRRGGGDRRDNRRDDRRGGGDRRDNRRDDRRGGDDRRNDKPRGDRNERSDRPKRNEDSSEG